MDSAFDTSAGSPRLASDAGHRMGRSFEGVEQLAGFVVGPWTVSPAGCSSREVGANRWCDAGGRFRVPNPSLPIGDHQAEHGQRLVDVDAAGYKFPEGVRPSWPTSSTMRPSLAWVPCPGLRAPTSTSSEWLAPGSVGVRLPLS